MAEQEVIKHTKKIFSIWGDKEHNFWHKLKEFFIEIVIIVFAVSLSIWLHDRSEHAHGEEEAKAFLLGLKDDLAADSTEFLGAEKIYANSSDAFSYVLSIKIGQNLNKDSLKARHGLYLFWFEGLMPNSARYEGFKSAGKIGSIENKTLQNDILGFYQQDLVDLRGSIDFYNQKKQKLYDYVMQNRKRETDSTTNLDKVLETDESRNFCGDLSNIREVSAKYDICLQKIRKVIAEIDEEYNK